MSHKKNATRDEKEIATLTNLLLTADDARKEFEADLLRVAHRRNVSVASLLAYVKNLARMTRKAVRELEDMHNKSHTNKEEAES